MGPVLLFRYMDDQAVHLCALVVTEGGSDPDPLQPQGGAPVPFRVLLTHHNSVLWGAEFSLPLHQGPMSYSVGGADYEVHTPPAEGPRVLFTACNGSEEPELLPEDPQRTLPWRRIAEKHAEQPYHLSVQGGDQVYGDQVWHSHPELTRFKNDREAVVGKALDQSVEAAIFDHYFNLYVDTWSDTNTAPVLARVPSVMIWDDHDIIDGWGSWPDDIQNSEIYEGLFQAAHQTYLGFQLGVRPGDQLPKPFLRPDASHLGWYFNIGDVGFYAPDLRSERTQDEIMAEAGWTDMDSVLRRAQGLRRLFVVSSVPLMNATFRTLERIHFAVPGHQFLQDDLRDQWQSYRHASQWERFTRQLLDYRRQSGACISVLSGEIHFAARAVLEAEAGPIHQLTSSGVVHPAPPRFAAQVLNWLGRRRYDIGALGHFRMHILPGMDTRYLADRNWLTLEPFADGYCARWGSERYGDSDALDLG